MASEQMLLCTLLPFKNINTDFTGSFESQLSINWRFNEMRFFNAHGATLSLDIARIDHPAFLPLVGLQYCKLSVVVHATGEALAIRVTLLRDFIQTCFMTNAMCDPNFLSFESFLAKCFRSPYCIEQEKKKRKGPWDSSAKTYEVSPTVRVCDGVFWSYEETNFTTEAAAQVTVEAQAAVVVSKACKDWRATLLDQFLGARRPRVAKATTQNGRISISCLLVVTDTPDAWDAARVGPSGISMALAQDVAVLVTTPQIVAANVASLESLSDTVRTALTLSVMDSPRSANQINRLIVENLCKKFCGFLVPLGLFQFSQIILDTPEPMSLMGSAAGQKWVRVFVDDVNIRPKGLTSPQTASLTGAQAHHWSVAHVCPLFLSIPVSKAVMRKFRIISHAVKLSPTEERISKIFATKYCPIPITDALQRFSGRPMPLPVALALVRKHFDRLQIPLGAFVDPTVEAIPLSQTFVELAWSGPKSCCICFEEQSQACTMTICGHAYCNECARHHFDGPKECAKCRAPLVSGDVFQLDDKRYAPMTTGMETCITSFMATVRNMSTVGVWDHDTDIERVRQLIVSNVWTTKPVDIVSKFYATSGLVAVHVFYTQDQRGPYNNFISNFYETIK